MRIESNKYLTEYEFVVEWKWADRVTMWHFSEYAS